MLTMCEQPIVAAFATERPTDIARALTLLGRHARARGTTLVTASTASEPPDEVLAALRTTALAARVSQFVEASECEQIARRVEARLDVEGPALQVVGGAWFLDHDDDTAGYFGRAGDALSLVDEVAPGLLERVLAWCRRFTGAPVSVREGWCPPSFVTIRARAVAGMSGDVHFDWEGLAAHPNATLATECYSLVLTVQPASWGGGLHVWDVTYQHGAVAAPPTPLGVKLTYQPGDLVVFPAQHLHAIEAMSGTATRVTLTGHLARFPEGWRVWL